ncbi:MAG: PEP-CTERM sorting domain-containing protein [Chlorobiaceae bacterium]|nr:PEP-CTERM sorting domain-containing protein [Chlorobiaceae bacterium]
MKKIFPATLLLLLLLSLGSTRNALATTLTINDLATTGQNEVISSGVLTLTPNTDWQTGAAFSAPVNISSFTATFSFQFSGTYPETGSADGIVFVVQNPAEVKIGTRDPEGGGMGYFDITESIGIEFDNWPNNDHDDPVANHIGIDLNGIADSYDTLSLTTATNGATDFNNGNTGSPRIWYAWVDYDGTTLSVSTNTSGDKPLTPQLAKAIDLTSSAYVNSTTGLIGFTGATGWASQEHKVLSLNYETNPVPEPSSMALLGIGGLLTLGYNKRKGRK